MPVAVGLPIGRYRVRVPDLAVIGGALPGDMFVELLVAAHRRRDVIGRGEAMLAVIARPAPLGESVGNGALERCGQGVPAADYRHVAGLDAEIVGAPDKPRAALEHRDPRRLVLG